MMGKRSAGPWRGRVRLDVGGCAVGALGGAILAVMCVLRLTAVPRDMLPLDTATGYLVFGGQPFPGLTDRHYALDMRSGVLHPLLTSYGTMSPSGAWVVLDDGTCRGPDGRAHRAWLRAEPARSLKDVLRYQVVVGDSGTLVEALDGRLRVVDLPAGRAREVAVPGLAHCRSVAADGKTAVVALRAGRDHPEYRVDLASGALEPLVEADKGAVSLSGDRAIVGRGGCIIVSRAGGERERIRGPGAWIDGLRWSPDGRFLAYSYPARTEEAVCPMVRYWMAVGLLDLKTRRHYRPPPVYPGGAALDMVQGYRWVSAVPDWLLDDAAAMPSGGGGSH